ncbi:MAG: NAD(P)H-binding protein, partial [Candidatus Nanoarchaeia archaeon]
MAKKILVLGGRGFVGSAICKELRKKHRVFTFDRHKGGKSHCCGDISCCEELEKHMKGKHIVINLVGLSPLRKPAGNAYHAAHVVGVNNIIRACKKVGVKRLIHMGILGSDSRGKTLFLRTRGKGETLVRQSRLNWTIIRPSIIFDKDNELVQQCSKLAFTCMFPYIPAKIQPVYRGDVAKIYRMVVDGKIKTKIVNVGGPQRMNVFQFAKRIYNKKGFPCYPIPLSPVRTVMKYLAALDLFG